MLQENILFLHAVLECDTTSQLYSIGKGTSLKKFKSSKHFQEQAKVSAVESATLKDISAAGEQVLVNVYNGTPGESLDSLRYKLFCEKVATNTMCIYSSPDSTSNFSCCKMPYTIKIKCAYYTKWCDKWNRGVLIIILIM